MAEMPWWWIVLLSGSTVVAMAISLIVPAVTAYSLHREKFQKKSKRQPGDPCAAAAGAEEASGAGGGVEMRRWPDAAELPGCPWNFEGCAALVDALERVWMPLPDQELMDAFSVLRDQLKDLQVARISAIWPDEVEYFAVVYTLLTGAKLFGVAPLEHEVSLQLSHEASMRQEVSLDRSPPRRPSSPRASRSMIQSKAAGAQGAGSRRGWSRRLEAGLEGACGGLARARGLKACDLTVHALTPFYRIHDGFGSVLSELDLPALLSKPDDAVAGSCFYVYPTRSLQPIPRWRNLVKFARVDSSCVVCVDRRRRRPGIVYLERGRRPALEEYDPLAFAADTVRNIAAPPPQASAGAGSAPVWEASGREEKRPGDVRSEMSWAVSPRTHEERSVADAASEHSRPPTPTNHPQPPDPDTTGGLVPPRSEAEAALGSGPRKSEARPPIAFASPELLRDYDIRRTSL